MAGNAPVQQAATAEQQSAAYEISVSQDGLKRDAASVRAELVAIRDQMRQLMPADAPAIDRAIAQMDSLSKEEMERVIQTLRGASKPEGLSGRAQALAATLRDQGTISASLKRLAIGLDARQSMDGLAGELSVLLQRQVATRNELVRISRRDQTPDRLRNRERESYDVLNVDQKSIGEDIKLVFQRLDKVAGTLTGDAQQNFARAVAVAREGKLAELADAAASQVAQGPFDQATGTQGQIATVLVNMEQALAGAKSTAEHLAALEDKLKKTLDQQKDLTQLIAGFHERQSVEHETKRLQTTISDQIAELHAELSPLNAQAAADLQVAQNATEAASQHYDRMWEERPEAQQSTRDAVAQLTAALQSVDKQAAALAANTPTTPAQIDAKVTALARDAAQAADVARNIAAAAPSATNAEQQKALESTVADLQQRALPVSPEAARELSDAAADLQQTGKPAQQAAAQQLAQAAQALAQQQAALEGRTPQQQALAQAEQQVAKANQDLAAAEVNMASSKTSADAVNQMEAIKQETAAAQRAAAQAGAPAEAQQALATAAQDVAQAQTAAAGVQLPQAQAAGQAAQKALAQATQAMEAARQAPMQQAMMAMSTKPGNDAGQRQEGNTTNSQGNGGGGKSGDSLAGAGDNAGPLEPVSGLNPQDRAAVTQLQAEKPPAEFITDVQQYYKNLADGAGL